MAFLIGGANSLTAGYEIDNSLRVNDDLHHLSLIFDSSETSANQKKFTASYWVKLGNAAQFSTTTRRWIITSTDAATSTDSIGYGYPAAAKFYYKQGAGNKAFSTTAVYRDPSAWYNVVVAVDTTDGTADDRVKMWVNGISQTLIQSNGALAENSETNFGNAGDDITATSADSGNFIHNINSYYNSTGTQTNFDGYLADINFHSGVVGTYLNFGEFNDNGVWIPKEPTLAYNAYSYRLEFKQTGTGADASGIGADTSGSTNHFAIGQGSGTAAIDVTTDTPTNNFCTLNPLANALTNPVTVSEANVKAVGDSDTWEMISSTMGASKGKWYWEAKLTALGSYAHIGVTDDFDIVSGGLESYFGHTGSGIAFGKGQDATIYHTGISDTSYGTTHAAGNIISVALDLDNNFIYFAKNGTYQDYSSATGDPTSGASGTGGFAITANTLYIPAVALQQATWEVNYGNPSFAISSSNADADGYGNFEYAVPSGYFSWCTKNLAEYG